MKTFIKSVNKLLQPHQWSRQQKTKLWKWKVPNKLHHSICCSSDRSCVAQQAEHYNTTLNLSVPTTIEHHQERFYLRGNPINSTKNYTKCMFTSGTHRVQYTEAGSVSERSYKGQQPTSVCVCVWKSCGCVGSLWRHVCSLTFPVFLLRAYRKCHVPYKKWTFSI